MVPASATTGRPSSFARRPTPAGILPFGVCASTEPFAAITRSAEAQPLSRGMASPTAQPVFRVQPAVIPLTADVLFDLGP